MPSIIFAREATRASRFSVTSHNVECLDLIPFPPFDSDKLCQAVHNGFALALCVVEPDLADEFLKRSSAMFESVFQKQARKKLGRA
jgi:hypothetical protein